jgi:phosphoenolpyruvate carboxylase
MENQITIEQMQAIIGRLTMNYELQITGMTKEIQRLAALIPQATPIEK